MLLPCLSGSLWSDSSSTWVAAVWCADRVTATKKKLAEEQHELTMAQKDYTEVRLAKRKDKGYGSYVIRGGGGRK